MPAVPGGRHLIPIRELHGTIQFRYVSTTAPAPRPRPTGTKWASCETHGNKEPQMPELGITGITLAGHPIFGIVAPQFTSFTSPCPLGTPPKSPKPPKQNKASSSSVSPIPTTPI